MGSFRKAHGNARTDGCGQADEEGLPCILRGEGGGENGRQRRDRTVHQTGQTGLNIGEQELTLFGFTLLSSCILGQVLVTQHGGHILMSAFRLGKITQQLARGGIGDVFYRLVVKADGLRFHPFRLFANCFERQILDEPIRLALIKATNMLAPDKRNDLAKPRPVLLDQHIAVGLLDLSHIIENARRLGILRFEMRRVGPVNAGIILLGG